MKQNCQNLPKKFVNGYRTIRNVDWNGTVKIYRNSSWMVTEQIVNSITEHIVYFGRLFNGIGLSFQFWSFINKIIFRLDMLREFMNLSINIKKKNNYEHLVERMQEFCSCSAQCFCLANRSVHEQKELFIRWRWWNVEHRKRLHKQLECSLHVLCHWNNPLIPSEDTVTARLHWFTPDEQNRSYRFCHGQVVFHLF